MPTFAAVDIGSNSCRLKIAKVVAHQLRTLHEDREVTRLGGGVFESGLVSPEAMANTIQALKRFQRRCRRTELTRSAWWQLRLCAMRATAQRFRRG